MNRSIRSLLGSIIDYAGMFPPAGLDLRTAVTNYSEYRTGAYEWLLGRFIVPAVRLEQLEFAVQRHSRSAVGERGPQGKAAQAVWRVSALAGPDLASDLNLIADFNQRNAALAAGDTAPPHASPPEKADPGPRLLVDTIELKATEVHELREAMRCIPGRLCAYVEMPVSSDESLLAAACSAGARVKVRTGGLTPQAFPSCGELAGFLFRCAQVDVPFKATAGLHHPIRSVHRLTYADDSPQGTMHGFLNVFLAATGLRNGMSAQEAEQLLEETSPSAFQFDDHGARWGHHGWTSDDLSATRHALAIAFGSCSLQEPIDDLKALKLL